MSEVLVFGGSIPALVAALDLAELGIGVRIANVPVNVPTGAVHDPSGEVSELLERLAAPISEGGRESEEARPVCRAADRVCLRARNGEWKPQPVPEVWGVPAVPISSDSIAVLGTGGALRAYLDRIKPVLTIGKQANLGKLIESRMGAAARELLAEPLVYERFGVKSTAVDAAIAAPGFNESLTVAGSLSGAVMQYSDRHVARETTVSPDGGWEVVAELLLRRLENYGAERLDAAVVRLDAEESDLWVARDEAGRERVYNAVIVSDAASLPAGSELRDEVASLEPSKFRAYVEIGINPGKPLVDASGEEVSSTLQLVADPSGSVWSVRSTPLGDSAWVAELAGPTTEGRPQQPTPSDVANLVTRAGLRAVGNEPKIRVEPAPHATQAERDAIEGSLLAWRLAHDTVVLASEALNAGDLGASLVEAGAHAVQLRRRLIGIAD